MAVFFFLSATTLVMLNLHEGDEEARKLLKIICLEMSYPTVFLFLAMIFVAIDARAIDLFGLSIQLPFTVVVYAFYLIPSMQVNFEGPNFQNYLFSFIYLCSCHFMCSNFLLTLVIRQVLGWSFIVLNIVMWQRMYQFNIMVNLLFFMASIVLVEGSNYASMRSKAQLFLKAKTMSMQEKQLPDILDAIPDKVLITTRGKET